jgi:hypothetical protein
MINGMKERVTVSLDPHLARMVRQRTASEPGGMSGYVERLIRHDQLKDAVAALGRWHAQHPEVGDADEAERLAAAEELGESA